MAEFQGAPGDLLTRIKAFCLAKVTGMQPAFPMRPIMSGGHESSVLQGGDEERRGALALRGCSCACLRNARLPFSPRLLPFFMTHKK